MLFARHQARGGKDQVADASPTLTRSIPDSRSFPLGIGRSVFDYRQLQRVKTRKGPPRRPKSTGSLLT